MTNQLISFQTDNFVIYQMLCMYKIFCLISKANQLKRTGANFCFLILNALFIFYLNFQCWYRIFAGHAMTVFYFIHRAECWRVCKQFLHLLIEQRAHMSFVNSNIEGECGFRTNCQCVWQSFAMRIKPIFTYILRCN